MSKRMATPFSKRENSEIVNFMYYLLRDHQLRKYLIQSKMNFENVSLCLSLFIARNCLRGEQCGS